MAALFYADNLDEVRLVIDEFDPDSHKAIKEAQQLMKKASLKADLAFIKANIGFLAGAILHLEEAGLRLSHSLEMVANAQRQLSNVSGSKILVFKEKLNQVVKKNEVLEVLNKINQVLQGEEEATLYLEINPDAAASLKLCPIVSMDIERSFSQYILMDRSHSITQQNLAKYVVCNYFCTRG